MAFGSFAGSMDSERMLHWIYEGGGLDLWRAWRSNRLRWWAVAGFLAGLSFYTYLPARLLPLVLIPQAMSACLPKAFI